MMFTDPTFYVLIAFILFFIAAGKPLFRAFTGILDKRIKEVSSNLEDASQQREEAQDRLNQAKLHFHQAQKHIDEMTAQAKSYSEEWLKKSRQELKELIEKREAMLKQRIAYMEAHALEEMRITAADLIINALTKEAEKVKEATDIELILGSSFKKVAKKDFGHV